jgi:hypothetical protein
MVLEAICVDGASKPQDDDTIPALIAQGHGPHPGPADRELPDAQPYPWCSGSRFERRQRGEVSTSRQ